MNKTSFEQFLSDVKDAGDESDSVLRILSKITKKQADAFANVCSLATQCYIETSDGEVKYWDKYTVLSIYDYIKFTYKIGLDFETLRELETLGLIATTMFGFKKDIDTEKHALVHFAYGDTILSVTDYISNSFPTGNILLTREGKYLSDFIQTNFYDEYIHILKSFLYKKALTIYELPLLRVKCQSDGNCIYEKINRDNPQEITFSV